MIFWGYLIPVAIGFLLLGSYATYTVLIKRLPNRWVIAKDDIKEGEMVAVAGNCVYTTESIRRNTVTKGAYEILQKAFDTDEGRDGRG